MSAVDGIGRTNYTPCMTVSKLRVAGRRAGRPTRFPRKPVKVTVRLTEAASRVAAAKADRDGMTFSDAVEYYIRKGSRTPMTDYVQTVPVKAQ